MRRDKGFTLLEVLIALALFSLMLSLILGTLWLTSRTFEAGEIQAEKIGGRLALERFLRSVLGQARVWQGSAKASPFGMVGTASELSFAAFLPHLAGKGGFKRITLYLAPKRPAGYDLRVRIAEADGTIAEGEEEARDQVLLEDVEALKFSYWEGSPGQGKWVESWEGTVLPKAVGVEIIRAGETWPPYLIPLPLGVATLSPIRQEGP
jgi:general secretion pathway protein J